MNRSIFYIFLFLWCLCPTFSHAISWNKTYQDYFHLHYDKNGLFVGADERSDVIG